MDQEKKIHQARIFLKFAFGTLFLITGCDKFFNVLVSWSQYLPHVLTTLVPNTHVLLSLIGCGEISVGLLVFFSPKIGGYIGALLFLGIIVSLALIPGYFNIMLIDLILSVCCFTLARLSE